MLLLTQLVCSIAVAGIASQAHGALRAYEPFDYPAGTLVATSNLLSGGFGWSSTWEDTSPGGFGNGPGLSVIEANSLSYTDSVGHVLITAGNKIFNPGTNGGGVGTTSRPWRSLTNLWGAAGTTNWISFVGIRINPTGQLLDRGANLTIFNLTNYTIQPFSNPPLTNFDGGTVAADANGRLAIGENSGTRAGFTNNDVWTLASNGAGAQRRFSEVPFTNLALIVIRIEHYNDGNEFQVNPTNDSDNIYGFINPTNLAIEPDSASAFCSFLNTETNIPAPYGYDMAFDSFALFAAAGNATQGDPAQWYIDEIRMGDTYADVVPFTGGAAPVTPRLTAIVPSGGGVSVTVTGAPNTTLTMQMNFSLTGTWNNIGNVNLNGSGIGTFNDTDPLATNQSRFYRAKP